MNTNHERRILNAKVELRAAADGKPALVVGYAAVYGSRSNTLRSSRGDFVEVIEPGFFEPALNDDVRALFNHDANLVLARSNAGKGSLRLFSDEVGLGYEFEAPDTTAGRDLVVSIKRGDVDNSSFGFRVKDGGDSWERRDGVLVRTLRKGGCAALVDVSPVTYPAYPETEVATRSVSIDQFLDAEKRQEAPTQPPLDLWEKRLAFLRK